MEPTRFRVNIPDLNVDIPVHDDGHALKIDIQQFLPKGKLEKDVGQEESQEGKEESKTFNLETIKLGKTIKLPDVHDEIGEGSVKESNAEQEIKKITSHEQESERQVNGTIRWNVGKKISEAGAVLIKFCVIACLIPGVFGNKCDRRPSVIVANYQFLDRSLTCLDNSTRLDCKENEKMVCLGVHGTSDLAVGCAPNMCINGDGSCPEWIHGEHDDLLLQYRQGECASCPTHYHLFDINKYQECQKRKKMPTTQRPSPPNIATGNRSSLSTIFGLIFMTKLVWIFVF